jgi:hypothetical protein
MNRGDAGGKVVGESRERKEASGRYTEHKKRSWAQSKIQSGGKIMNRKANSHVAGTTIYVCALILSLTLNSPPASAQDSMAASIDTQCRVFKPNLKPTETVSWSGACKDRLADGAGTASWFNNSKLSVTFKGLFKAGKIHGKGVMNGADGDKYDGEYKDGMRHGKGVYVSGKGERYEGEYENNLRHGNGVLIEANGGRYEGEFRNGTKVRQPPLPLSNSQPDPSGASAQPTPTKESGAAPTRAPISSQFSLAPYQCRVVLGTIKPESYPMDWTKLYLPKTDQIKIEGISEGDYQAVEKAILPILERARSYQASQPCDLRLGIFDVAVYLFFDKVLTNPMLLPDRLVSSEAPDSLAIAATRVSGDREWVVENAGYYGTKRMAQKTADQQRLKRLEVFAKKHRFEEIETKGLQSNPFALEGRNIFLVGLFKQMRTTTSGVFSWDEGPVVVSDIPKGTFVQPSKVFLIVKVLGNTELQGTLVPNLKYLGAMICSDERCQSMVER